MPSIYSKESNKQRQLIEIVLSSLCRWYIRFIANRNFKCQFCIHPKVVKSRFRHFYTTTILGLLYAELPLLLVGNEEKECNASKKYIKTCIENDTSRNYFNSNIDQNRFTQGWHWNNLNWRSTDRLKNSLSMCQTVHCGFLQLCLLWIFSSKVNTDALRLILLVAIYSFKTSIVAELLHFENLMNSKPITKVRLSGKKIMLKASTVIWLKGLGDDDNQRLLHVFSCNFSYSFTVALSSKL